MNWFSKRKIKGVTSIEYAILTFFIAMVIIGFLEITGVNLKNIFSDLGNSISLSSGSSSSSSLSQYGGPWQPGDGTPTGFASGNGITGYINSYLAIQESDAITMPTWTNTPSGVQSFLV